MFNGTVTAKQRLIMTQQHLTDWWNSKILVNTNLETINHMAIKTQTKLFKIRKKRENKE